jgi:hypothetical protein
VAVGFAQFSTSWHEATVQHVRCAEHGELTHVSSLPSDGPNQTSTGNAIRSAGLGTLDVHEHCGFVFAVQGSTSAPFVRIAVTFAPPPVVARQPANPAPRPGRAFVLASAPKTSPPAA